MFDNSKFKKKKTYAILSIFAFFLALLIYFIGIIWFPEASYIIAIIAIIFSVVSTLCTYYFSDSIVISLNSARPATIEETQRLVENLEGLCIAAGMSHIPELYIIDDGSINAFSAGRNPEHSVICVTRGCLKKLDSNEIEGVLAHELSHIKNYDTLLQAVAAICVGFITIISDLFFKISLVTFNSKGKNPLQFILLGLGFIFLAISPFCANMLKLTLSRTREYLADSSAIELTRNPEGLISALKKIASDKDRLSQANRATECLYFVNPIKTKQGRTSDIYSTHPAIEARICRLENIS